MTKMKRNGAKIFAILSILISFALCLTLADFFSNIITIKAFNNVITTSKNSGFSVYAISLGTFTNQTNANEYAISVQKQSGAGFVYLQDAQYYVLTSAYIEENDAKLVNSRLEENGLSPTIIKITIPPFSLCGNYSTSQQNSLSNAIYIFKTCFENLYDISVALDTAIKNENECKILIGDVENLINKTKLTFETEFSGFASSDIVNIKVSLHNLYETVQSLSSFSSTSSQTFSSKIKYSYLEVIMENISLVNNLAK